MRPARATLLLSIALTACVGTVSEDRPWRDGDLDVDTLRCDAPGAAPTPLRRLTRRELAHTLRDLLGEAAFGELSLEFGVFPPDEVGAGSVDELVPNHTAAHVEAMVSTGERAASALRAHPEALLSRGHGCILDAAPDDACARAFIEGFGRRVFRRPLSEDELADQLAFYRDAPDPAEGFTRVMMRWLSSPQLLFHVEVDGDETEDATGAPALRLSPYAVANRVSYMLTGSMPDDAMLDAAARGELDTLEGVEAQVRRLLETPEARETVRGFFEAWLALDETSGVPEDPALLDGLMAAGLRDAMLAETLTYVDQMVWEEGADYRTLMSSTAAYPEDAQVAGIYGVEPWRPGLPAPLAGPERPGLLLRPGVLLGEAHSTAPIMRGVFMLRQVLCGELAAPPTDIVNSRLDEVGELRTQPARAQIETLTGEQPCSTCHSRINPLAFALEDFDALGRHRALERVFVDGELVAEHPLDTAVELELDGATVSVDSGAALAHAIANSEVGHACFAERVFEHTRIRRPASAADHCLNRRVTRAMLDDGASLLDAFVVNVANDALFTRRLED